MTDDELADFIATIVMQLPEKLTQREICSLFATILLAYELAPPKRVYLLGMVEATILAQDKGKDVKKFPLNLRKH